VNFNDPTGYDVDCGIGESGCRDRVNQEYAQSIVTTLINNNEPVSWTALSSKERKLLTNVGWNQNSWDQWDLNKPGVSTALFYQDPAFYVSLLLGGAGGYLGPSAVNILRGLFGAEAYDCVTDGQCAVAQAANNIGATGDIGEQFLQLAGGRSQVYFQTTQGGRFIDQLINGMAYEAKVGYVTLTEAISLQVAKDVELLHTGVIDTVTWVFFKSPISGVGSPSGPLYQLLSQNGISVMFGQ